MSRENGISIKNKMKGRPPRLPFIALKDEVLGKNYDLSLVFVSKKESNALNKKYRGKNKPANILSFPLSQGEGEIIICLSEAKKDAPKFGLSYSKFVPYLFIHGLLHLKGMSHGSKMDKKEAALRKKFGFE